MGKASGGAVISSNVRRDVGSKGRNEKYDDAGTGRYTHTRFCSYLSMDALKYGPTTANV